MRRTLNAILAVLMIASLTTSSAFAGRMALSATFKLGSLIADGTLIGGLGNAGAVVILTAEGIPVVTCTNQGGNEAPGQNPPKVSGTGVTILPGNDPREKNGKTPFTVEAEPATLILPGTQGGCPNDNWTATIDFVVWTDATITLLADGVEVGTAIYRCTTVQTGPGMDNGTVQCKLVSSTFR